MLLYYLFAFLAGIATVLSPFVLPVLPAILSTGTKRHRYRPLGVIIGLTVSFTIFTLLLTYLVHSFGFSVHVLRNIAIFIIALFGLILLFPRLGNIAQKTAFIAKMRSNIQARTGRTSSGFIQGLLLGSFLGLIWTPSTGSILAVIMSLVATKEINLQVVILLSVYSIGSAIPLLLLSLGSNTLLTKIPSVARHAEKLRKTFGVLLILMAIGLSLDFDVALQQIARKYFSSLQMASDAIDFN